ncbi:hypothetical protein [Amycolatopsis sp. NPDC058986]|uniref:hypothetical protein n=1 Tax=unclassified Amycolatopsis TaxID=2618356 RepID=UPI00366ADEE2
MSEEFHYMIVANRNAEVGDLVPNTDATGNPIPAYRDPRSVSVVETFDDNTIGLLDLLQMPKRLVPLVAQVLKVVPNGRVSLHSELFNAEHCEDVVPEPHDAVEAEGGWTVRALMPVETILGPQGAQVVAAVRAGFPYFDELCDEQVLDSYVSTGNMLHTNRKAELDAALDAAENALDNVAADGLWWTRCAMACNWNNEIPALAARDLIGTTPGWNQEAYDLLTLPWRTALPTVPLHADDKPLAATASHPE